MEANEYQQEDVEQRPTAICQKVRLPIGRRVKNGHEEGTKEGKRKRERRGEESFSWVTKKWGEVWAGRRAAKRKVCSWECYDIRALSRKATQTVTLRRRIDKILGRDVLV